MLAVRHFHVADLLILILIAVLEYYTAVYNCTSLFGSSFSPSSDEGSTLPTFCV